MGPEDHFSFTDTQTAFAYKSDKQLYRAYRVFKVIQKKWIADLGMWLFKWAIWLKLPVLGLIRRSVFEHFCGGENIDDAESTILHMAQFGVKTILDYSVEGDNDEAGYQNSLQEILRTIERSKSSEVIPFSVFKVSGIGNVDVLEKVQAQKPLTGSEGQQYANLKCRMDEICQSAYASRTPVLVDAEESWIQGAIDDLVYTLMERYNHETAIVFNTYQLYRKDGLEKLKAAYQRAQSKRYVLGAKLVRGAYLEKERDRAHDMGYTNPIFRTKAETDTSFDQALKFSVSSIASMRIMCGSHNERSNLFLTQLMRENNIKPSDSRIWFAQLYGMGDIISFNLARQGYNVVKYVPYGPIKSVMPYLHRRAQENTSVEGQANRELEIIRLEKKRRSQKGSDK